ncbi:MAG: leucyl/phenylalanyl-tRNA--protein transferase [Burkholderiales bacterium]|nr:leucyl/phenylalanyl-tRNA--protein transferase [Burkholderiales bacterium]
MGLDRPLQPLPERARRHEVAARALHHQHARRPRAPGPRAQDGGAHAGPGARPAVLGEHRRRPRRRRRQRPAGADAGAGVRLPVATARPAGLTAWIDEQTPLPPATAALGPGSGAAGLVAAGGGLAPRRLEEAYRGGLFPWYSPGQPVLWWSPDPRMVLPTAEFRLSRSLAKTIRRFRRTPGCALRVDSAFEQVIAACATQPREGQDGTWIVPAMVEAYTAWHRLGRVHSVETWVDGELAGGLYFVAIGRMCFGESMFARRTDASKIALAALVAACRAHGVGLIDCQQNTDHLASFGAREMPRAEFLARVAQATAAAGAIDWSYDDSHWALLERAPAVPPEAP